MSFTFADVLDTIRDKHPVFDPLLSGDAALARHLSDYQTRLLKKAISANPQYASLSETITLPLVDFENGIAVADGLNHFGATLRLPNNAKRYPVRLTNHADRFTPRRFPSAYVMESVLYLMGKESKWANGSTILLRYTPIPTDITALASVFTVKDDARGCCAAAGAVFLAGRVFNTATQPQAMSPFTTALKDEETTFLQTIGLALGPE